MAIVMIIMVMVAVMINMRLCSVAMMIMTIIMDSTARVLDGSSIAVHRRTRQVACACLMPRIQSEEQ